MAIPRCTTTCSHDHAKGKYARGVPGKQKPRLCSNSSDARRCVDCRQVAYTDLKALKKRLASGVDVGSVGGNNGVGGWARSLFGGRQ